MANVRVGSGTFMAEEDAPLSDKLGGYGYAAAIIPDANTRFAKSRAIYATVAGTATLVFPNPDGSELVVADFPLAVGENKFRVIGVEAATATGLFRVN